MPIDFAAAMRRATDATRALDVAGATRIIQNALGRGAANEAETPVAPRGDTRRPAPDVEDAEVVDPAPSPRPKGARRSLGEVVRALREGRHAIPGFGMPLAPRPMVDMPLPDGARFEARRYACAAGSRGYRLYVPASAAGGARGLIVMLHGCTQTPEDFAAGTGMNTLAEKHRLIVVYPAQTQAHNPNACWNWFRPEDQARGAGEPAIVAGLTAALVAEFDVPRDRVFVAGLSAGGAAAAVLGETYPDLYAGVGVHSGIAPGAARDVQSAFAAMRGAPARGAPRPSSSGAPRIIVFHGSADATVHPSNAAQVYARSGRRVPDPAAGEARGGGNGTRRATRAVTRGADGASDGEFWLVEGAGHAWSGGNPAGSFTDPSGPDASAEMVRFFLEA